MEKYPSWPKGLPWKGSRSLIAARGFKSLLLRWLRDQPRTLKIEDQTVQTTLKFLYSPAPGRVQDESEFLKVRKYKQTVNG